MLNGFFLFLSFLLTSTLSFRRRHLTDVTWFALAGGVQESGMQRTKWHRKDGTTFRSSFVLSEDFVLVRHSTEERLSVQRRTFPGQSLDITKPARPRVTRRSLADPHSVCIFMRLARGYFRRTRRHHRRIFHRSRHTCNGPRTLSVSEQKWHACRDWTRVKFYLVLPTG